MSYCKGTALSECRDSALILCDGEKPQIFHEIKTVMEISTPILLAAADVAGGLPGGRKASEFAEAYLCTVNR